MTAIAPRPTPQRAVLELQARARDHALRERIERTERTVARLHARIDGAMATVVAATSPPAHP